MKLTIPVWECIRVWMLRKWLGLCCRCQMAGFALVWHSRHIHLSVVGASGHDSDRAYASTFRDMARARKGGTEQMTRQFPGAVVQLVSSRRSRIQFRWNNPNWWHCAVRLRFAYNNLVFHLTPVAESSICMWMAVISTKCVAKPSLDADNASAIFYVSIQCCCSPSLRNVFHAISFCFDFLFFFLPLLKPIFFVFSYTFPLSLSHSSVPTPQLIFSHFCFASRHFILSSYSVFLPLFF